MVPSLNGHSSPKERIRYSTHAPSPDQSTGLRGTVQTRHQGLVDTPQHHQSEVYDEFQEQLLLSEEGWYEAALPWKCNQPPPPPPLLSYK